MESAKSCPLIYEQTRLFAGESFRWASVAFPHGIPQESAAKLAVLVKNLVPLKLSNETSTPALEATSYMVLGYSITDPQVDKRHSLIDKLLCIGFESQTLNASLCYLVCGMEANL